MGNKRYVVGTAAGAALGTKVGVAALGTAVGGVIPLAIVGWLVVRAFFPNARRVSLPTADPTDPAAPAGTRTLKQKADAIRARQKADKLRGEK